MQCPSTKENFSFIIKTASLFSQPLHEFPRLGFQYLVKKMAPLSSRQEASWSEIEVCFLFWPPGFPAMPQYFNLSQLTSTSLMEPDKWRYQYPECWNPRKVKVLSTFSSFPSWD